MKKNFLRSLFMFFTTSAVLLSFESLTWAKNSCSCLPVTYGEDHPTVKKEYIGEARQKTFWGTKIEWKCEYRCAARMENGEVKSEVLWGSHKMKFSREENGTEGVCEGMNYEAEYSYSLQKYVYMWKGQLNYFNPVKSSSEELNDWAETNDCSWTLFKNY